MTILSVPQLIILTKNEQNSNRLETFFLTATQAFYDIDSAFGKLLCIVVGCSLNMFLEYHPSARISYYCILFWRGVLLIYYFKMHIS
jgi:hypothetical protein